MTDRSAVALLFSVSMALSAAAHAQTPAKTQEGVLTDQAGMTLYTFDKDTAGSGKSVCNDQCAKAWPPLAAPADAQAQGDYSVVVRDDGARQWAYKGKPLYTFVKDAKAGDKNGDNVRDIWHVAKP